MRPYTLRQLETFLAVAREMSVSRAAEHLHVTQPAVSLQAVLQAGVQFLEALAGLLAQGKPQDGQPSNGHGAASGLVGTDAQHRTGRFGLGRPPSATRFATVLDG